MWSNRYWAKTYWAGNYWTPNTQAPDVELLGGGGYVYIPASQKRPAQKIAIKTILKAITQKPLPQPHIKKDLKELSKLFKTTIKKPQDLERIDTLDLLKEQKATELLIKMYLNILAKEEDDLLMLLITLDLI